MFVSLSPAVLTIVHYVCLSEPRGPHHPPLRSVSLSALLSFTILHYVLAFTSLVLLYVFYTQPDDCTEHKVVISLNLLFCIIVSIVSILPKVQVIPILIRSLGLLGRTT